MLSRLLNSLEYRFLRSRSKPVKDAWKNLRREFAISRKSDSTRPRFDSLGSGLKLHLGSGADVRVDWINIDINLNNDVREGDPSFFNYDLRRGIPLPSGSCSIVYSSHFFEHLTNSYGQQLFCESYRVLEVGGTFRIALPNQEKMCRLYLERDWSHIHRFFNLKEMFPGIEPTYGDFFDMAIYQYGEHVTYYDVERTVRILGAIGFSEIKEDEYKEGLDPSDELRRFGSFYVEARK